MSHPTFRIVCDRSWDELAPRGPAVRFCSRCEREVHACADAATARQLAAAGWCVALTHEAARRTARMPAAGPPKKVTVGQLAGGDFPVVGWLVVLDGPMQHLTLQLGETTTIGSSPPADLVLPDGAIAALHVEVQCAPAGFRAVDRSGRGFAVNEQVTTELDLVDNDVLRVGGTRLAFKSAV